MFFKIGRTLSQKAKAAVNRYKLNQNNSKVVVTSSYNGWIHDEQEMSKTKLIYNKRKNAQIETRDNGKPISDSEIVQQMAKNGTFTLFDASQLTFCRNPNDMFIQRMIKTEFENCCGN